MITHISIDPKLLVDKVIQIQSRSKSDPSLSDINFEKLNDLSTLKNNILS